jgi:hypothetical protein
MFVTERVLTVHVVQVFLRLNPDEWKSPGETVLCDSSDKA